MSRWEDCLNEIERSTGTKECSMLVYGTSKTGKTTLIQTLMGGNGEPRGTPGPCQGTTRVEMITLQNDVTVYDTPGLHYDTVDEVQGEIARVCHPKDMACVFICFALNDSFDEKILTSLHNLAREPDSEVWIKVVFILTKCDELPATYKREDDETKAQGIQEMIQQWKKKFRSTLEKLEVKKEVRENIEIACTTYTEEEEYMDWSLYGLNNDDQYTSKDGVLNCVLRNFEKRPDNIESVTLFMKMKGNWKKFVKTLTAIIEHKLTMPIGAGAAAGGGTGAGVCVAAAFAGVTVPPAVIAIAIICGIAVGGGAGAGIGYLCAGEKSKLE